jgi:(2Fe-2S) ferredoxin
LKSELKKNGLHGVGKIRVTKSGCLGRCKLGPCMVVYPEGIWYHYASFSDIDKIISSHLLNGEIVKALLLDKKA